MATRFKDVAVGDRFTELSGCRTPGRVWIVEKKTRGIFGKQPNKIRMWSRCEGPGVVTIDYSMAEINRLFMPVKEEETAQLPEEHRGSRALDADIVREAPREPIDRMFQEAADAGFKPVTEEQAEAMRQKLRSVSAQIHGRRTA